MSLHNTGELTCPRCGAVIDAGFTSAEPDAGEEVRVSFECPACGAPLEVVIASSLPVDVGLEVWVEDRREGDGEG